MINLIQPLIMKKMKNAIVISMIAMFFSCNKTENITESIVFSENGDISTFLMT
jgi:hypothetical protein